MSKGQKHYDTLNGKEFVYFYNKISLFFIGKEKYVVKNWPRKRFNEWS